MTKHDDKTIIEHYLNWYRTHREEYWWAWEEVDKRRSPGDLLFVFDLIKACLNDPEIAYVAAGPLNELFSQHHLIVKKTLNNLVRQNQAMRKAIQALILSPESPARKTLDELLTEYGLTYASI